MSAKLNIEYIELRNFLSYGDYITRLDVANLGPVLILGEVEAEDDIKSSNGAGKSSILSAFIWCLFGRTIINSSPGDRVVNWFNGKNCYVKIGTADGWEIIRTRCFDGHSELILRKDGDDETQSTNQNAQKKLEELFGLDYDIFTSSVFCGQFGKSFLEMVPVKRKETIERLLGLDRLNQFADLSKEQCQQIEKNQELFRSKIEFIGADIKRQETRLEQSFTSHLSFEDDRSKRLVEIQDKIDNIKTELATTQVPDISSLKKQWELADAIMSKLEEYQSTIRQNQLKITSLEKELERVEQALDNYNNWSQEDIDFKKLTEEHKTADLAEKKLKELSSQASEVSGNIRYYNMEIASFQNKISQWEEKSNTDCDSCGQSINENHVEIQTAEINEKLIKIKSQCTSAIHNQQSLEKIKELISQIKRPNTSLSEAQKIIELNSKIATEIVKLENDVASISQERMQLQKENSGISIILESALNKFKNSRPTITLQKAQQLQSEHDVLQERDKNYRNQLKSIKTEANPYTNIINDLKVVANDLSGDLVKNENEIKELDVLFDHYRYIYRSYSDRRKIKSWLLSELIPFLNDRISYYLDMLSVDIKIKFSTTLSAETDRWDYEFCSGGERKRIDLALMFGLYDLYMSIYGQQCNIMVLDEVDSRLDCQGVEAFSEIINDICTNDDRPRPSTIFVISHKQELQSLFPSQVVIKKKGTFSHIDQTVFSTDQK